ncbi:helix-turn-helix domain-containing protein [Cryptobacterium curtum]|uniref:PucR family transcriptional regulator n=1 Tax=Cryptobacterium curtum TaxID=84163 RepID=UPI0028D2BF95|nr:helix-turn-helix domain-containing protein [Cryptobacterium curtum]
MKVRNVLYAIRAKDIALFNPSILNENAVCVQTNPEGEINSLGIQTITLINGAGFAKYRRNNTTGLLLVVVDGSIPKNLSHPSSNTIVCNSMYDFYNVQRRFLNLIRTESLLETNKSRIFDIFKHTYNIQQFVQGVHSLIGNPIIVVDSDEHILATAGDFTSTRSDFATQISNGYTLETSLSQMKEDHIIEQARKLRAPHISTNRRYDDSIPWITSIIYYKDLELGRFDVMGSIKSFDAHDLEIIDMASSLAGIILDRNDHTASHVNQGASVLNDLLDKKFMSEESATRLLRETGFTTTGMYSIGIVVGKESLTTPGFNAHIGRIVSEVLSKIAWVVRDGTVALLLPLEKADNVGFPYYRQLHSRLVHDEKLIEIMENNSLTAVFSSPFSNILRCSDAYETSLKLAASRSLENTLSFSWEHRYELIAMAFGEMHDATSLLDKRVLAMAHYDKQHQTEYFKTLRAHLYYAGNVKESSKALNIHRNTYFYRMNKIKELFYLDPNNGKDNLDAGFTVSIIDNNPQLID